MIPFTLIVDIRVQLLQKCIVKDPNKYLTDILIKLFDQKLLI